MKVVSYQGGLGNQMFQFAFQKRLELAYPNEEILAETFSFENYTLHQGFELETKFNITLKHCSREQLASLSTDNSTFGGKIKRKLLGAKRSEITESEEHKFRFNPAHFSLDGDHYFSGYWQSFQYFDEIRQELLKGFIPSASLEGKNEDAINAMQQSNSVSIHIRRGDYLNHPNFSGICDLAYYQNALKLIHENIESPNFFVFSDDIDWCRTNLPLEDATFINWNSGADSYLDMILMSKCKNNVIANSSFSWWGAYLNQNESKIVVAPSKWKNNMEGTRDLLPESWLIVSTE